MNIEPRNLGIPLQERSRFAVWLGLGVTAAGVGAYLMDPTLGKAMLATVLLVLPASVLAGAAPLRRGQHFGLNSLSSALLLALLVGYLLVAKRWLLPCFLSALG